jgi:hypothetical protein
MFCMLKLFGRYKRSSLFAKTVTWEEKSFRALAVGRMNRHQNEEPFKKSATLETKLFLPKISANTKRTKRYSIHLGLRSL